MAYGLVIARNRVVYSVLRDMARLRTCTTERVIEYPLVEELVAILFK